MRKKVFASKQNGKINTNQIITMKTTYTDGQLQAVIDYAIRQSSVSELTTVFNGDDWASEELERLSIAKAFLEKLEASTPDPYAELKEAHAEGKVIEHRNMGDTWTTCALPSWTFSPDFYRIKPEPSTFEARGKKWTCHTPGDALPDFQGKAILAIDKNRVWTGSNATNPHYWSAEYSNPFIGWRYADDPTPPTPAIGDVVKLKSGGPKMTVVDFVITGSVVCRHFDGAQMHDFVSPSACLTLAAE